MGFQSRRLVHPAVEPLTGFGGDRRQHQVDGGQHEYEPHQTLPGRRPDRTQDCQDRGQWSQHHNEVHQQGMGGQAADHGHGLMLAGCMLLR